MTRLASYLFVEPLDVLVLRGNKLFGDPGSFGESLVPPWPSVAAGAIRSALLARKNIVEGYAKGAVEDPELGRPQKPGPFRILDFCLARWRDNGGVELLRPVPADVVVRQTGTGAFEALRMRPIRLAETIQSSAVTSHHAVLAERERAKPVGGLWLTAEGWKAYLRGQEVGSKAHLVKSADLWSLDARVGVGLDPVRRSAAEGQLFTVQAVALRKRYHVKGDPCDVGFLVQLEGAQLPEQMTLRFGGDGRVAIATVVPPPDTTDFLDEVVSRRRCRVVLVSPGLFTHGWLPNGARPDERREDGAIPFFLHGVSGWIVCAALPRYEVVSGWDLAQWQPKPAHRAVPAGAVYWLDELDASTQALHKLAAEGLWSDPPENALRRAEGFNRIAIAKY
ncbi:MAG: type III-B CRISPR module-associated protein Cmr3 [Casimicrobiaceae bacterium]|nr:type III-B CRISPR module-associated protein Cmr3 [Casimicrobiaceae bacterium]